MDKQFGIAVKALIRDERNRYLLLYRSEASGHNKVDIPGGRLGLNETFEQCLKREVKEETGLKIRIIKPLRTWSQTSKNLHLSGITFLAEKLTGKLTLSDEHKTHEWIGKKDALQRPFPKWLKDEFSF
jgi:8-oxo-dGTP diphosphatase